MLEDEKEWLISMAKNEAFHNNTHAFLFVLNYCSSNTESNPTFNQQHTHSEREVRREQEVVQAFVTDFY